MGSQDDLETALRGEADTTVVLIGLMIDTMQNYCVCVDDKNGVVRSQVSSCVLVPQTVQVSGRSIPLPRSKRAIVEGQNGWVSWNFKPPPSWKGIDDVLGKEILDRTAKACPTGSFIDATNAGEQLNAAFAQAASQIDRSYG